MNGFKKNAKRMLKRFKATSDELWTAENSITFFWSLTSMQN